LILSIIAVLLTVVGILGYRATQQGVRRPGEDLPDITQKLALDLPEEAPMPTFVDVTAAAGLGEFVTFTGTRTSQLPEDMGSGAAWGDFDDDGDDDLFLVGAGGSLEMPQAEWAESMLFENRGNGRFERVRGFPETRIMGMGAAWGDADGDGRLDLAVTGYNALLLFLNTEDGFVRDQQFPDMPGYWSGVSWGDMDNDRDLDLYISGYVQYEEDASAGRQVSEHYGTAVPYTLNPASFEPASNMLLENDGTGRFEDVAVLWGVSNPAGRSLSTLWTDFNADGLLDLYVANDISDNALFLNLGETFEDAGLSAWVADYRGAMGLTTGDWNRDGDDDLFVTHWMAQENALYDSRLVDFQQQRGDSNQPPQLSFSDLSAPLGLGQPALQSVGWGTEFADFDGDGWLDLVIANGSTIETKENSRLLKRQAAMLFWNESGKAFHDLAPLNELFSTPTLGRGLAVSDFDQDGDQDVLMVHLDGGVMLLANEMQSGNWVALRLRSMTASGETTGRGEGSVAIVRAAGVQLRRTVGGASYISQSSPILHFGLGDATAIESVEVIWHGGESETFSGVAPGSAWELTEGEGVALQLEWSGGGAGADVASALGRRIGQEVPKTEDERSRLVEFWRLQREGMNLVKLEDDCERAVEAFRAALELNPGHEDSLYYLGNCLVALGRTEEGLEQLATLREVDPMSHRGHTQWGVVRGLTARSRADLEASEAALARALEINQEETGSLVALGEASLLLGKDVVAREKFEKACQTNPQAANAFFFRAYLAWKADQVSEMESLLAEVRRARGPEWKPEGSVAEGDTVTQMHVERTPLFRYAESWDGDASPEGAFNALKAHLESKRFEG
jgi:tetratricopeptide (TPR) repeat protein